MLTYSWLLNMISRTLWDDQINVVGWLRELSEILKLILWDNQVEPFLWPSRDD